MSLIYPIPAPRHTLERMRASSLASSGLCRAASASTTGSPPRSSTASLSPAHGTVSVSIRARLQQSSMVQAAEALVTRGKPHIEAAPAYAMYS